MILIIITMLIATKRAIKTRAISETATARTATATATAAVTVEIEFLRKIIFTKIQAETIKILVQVKLQTAHTVHPTQTPHPTHTPQTTQTHPTYTLM